MTFYTTPTMRHEAKLSEVLAGFGVDPESTELSAIGQGNINDTYLVKAHGNRFVLQRINERVFPDPKVVIDNFFVLGRHFTKQIDDESKDTGQLVFAAPIRTASQDQYFLDSSGGYWRAQHYLECADSRNTLEPLSKVQALSIGSVLSSFHSRFKNLDLSLLKDPLPGFHDLRTYLQEFDKEVMRISLPESQVVEEPLRYIESFRALTGRLEDAKNSGVLTPQAVHGDPKEDNFIFGENGIAIGLLDLDTVGPGLIVHDIGDCLRSCCNRIGESPASSQLPEFDLTLCGWILEGYLNTNEKLLSKEQVEYIYEGLLLITFELGLRFFTDHLRGDIYFKVLKHGDNLDKALIQFQLANDISAKEKQIREFVRSFSSR